MTTVYLTPPLTLQYSHRSSTYLPHDSPSSPTSDDFVLDSPIDPVGVIGRRQRPTTGGSDFFSAVYLDSPYTESIHLVSSVIGSTAPLRIHKKAEKAAPSRRHSTQSLPRSIRTTDSLSLTTLSTLTHQTSTSSQTSRLHPHHSISNLFLQFSPLIMSPIQPLTTHLPTRSARSASGQSELHLGLGRFGVYDESAKPGPSPTTSPVTSPVKRRFQIPITPVTPPTRTYAVPNSPITPARAPSKAAKLLGASIPTIRTKSSRKNGHFRPLPTQTLVEIEKFFGSTRKVDTVRVDRVGEGGTVRHRGGNGRMWSDLEEEQEFAWLMAETGRRAGSIGVIAEVDGRWGMGDFTSVLSLSKGSKTTDNSVPVKPRPTRTQTEPVHPWSTPEHSQREYQPLLTPPKSIIIPPPRSTSSRSAPFPQSTHTRDRSSSPFSDPESPPRPKHRPPPLTLSTQPNNPRLPMISRTPLAHNPNTTFTEPRTAPNPFENDSPPPLPRLLPAAKITSFMDMLGEAERDVSFFEPITPVEERPLHRRIGSGGGKAVTEGLKAEKGGIGGGWLKRVAKKGGMKI